MKIQRNHHTFTIEIPEAIDYSIPVVQITIEQNASIDECLEAFQGFLYAVGYRFPKNATIGLEYCHDNESVKKKETYEGYFQKYILGTRNIKSVCTINSNE
jgi:hypothetical protein